MGRGGLRPRLAVGWASLSLQMMRGRSKQVGRLLNRIEVHAARVLSTLNQGGRGEPVHLSNEIEAAACHWEIRPLKRLARLVYVSPID